MPVAEETIEIRPQMGPQEAFLSTPADIAIYGGAAGGGKSYALLIEALRHVHVPGYYAVIFRRTVTQVRNEGGLWDDSGTFYGGVGGRPRESNTEWRFESGASIRFAHLEHEKNRLDWQGSQIAFLGFDELTHFTRAQFWYMFSRCRTGCGVRPYVRATCNPDPDSFVADLVSWYIDQETGYAIPERCGKLRYFIRNGDRIEWASKKETLIKNFPTVDPDLDIKSFTFIASSIFDNQILLDKDPGYIGNLRALPLVDRERLLEGNWKIRETAGNVYRPREWMGVVELPPGDVIRELRYWDRAATEKRKPGHEPAYTSGVRMTLDSRAVMYVEHVARFRGEPAKVERGIKTTAEHDGVSCDIYLEQDPGQAGKVEVRYLIGRLAGYNARAIRAVSNKAVRARPASAQMEAGHIKMVKGSWNKAFVDELEAFPDGKFKDQADAFAGAVSMLLAGAEPRVRSL